MAALLQAKNISCYRGENLLFDNLNLDLNHGEVLQIVRDRIAVELAHDDFLVSRGHRVKGQVQRGECRILPENSRTFWKKKQICALPVAKWLTLCYFSWFAGPSLAYPKPRV